MNHSTSRPASIMTLARWMPMLGWPPIWRWHSLNACQYFMIEGEAGEIYIASLKTSVQKSTPPLMRTRLASRIGWEVGFDAGRVISIIPDTREQMKRFGFLPFYRAIKTEGIAV